MIKKITIIIFALILIFNFSVEASNNLNSSIEYVLHNIKVDSDDGKYIEDVFSKYDSEVYEYLFEQKIVGEFDYLLDEGSLKSRITFINNNNLTELDELYFKWERKENLKVEIGNLINPELNKYFLSFKKENRIKGLKANIKTEINQNNIEFEPIYLRISEDLNDYKGEIAVIGIKSNFKNEETKFKNGSISIFQTEPLNKNINIIQSQTNYFFNAKYKALEWLSINTDMARSEKDDLRYSEKVNSNLLIADFLLDINKKTSMKLSYHNVHELYVPIRTTEFKKEYDFRTNDYNKGYQIDIDYKLPQKYYSFINFKYNDFYRTNTYIQAAPYVQEGGFEKKLKDNRIKTYEIGLITERPKIYSRLFYTYETTKNNSDLDLKIDPANTLNKEEEFEYNYSPGYLDEKANIIHLYGRYNIFNEKKYKINIDGRYVKEWRNNLYHNYGTAYDNSIEEDTLILGMNGSYIYNNQISFDFDYDWTKKHVNFTVGEFTTSETDSQLHNLKLNTVYNFKENIDISLNYNYKLYDLIDYVPTVEDEIYRYYDNDFNTQEITISLKIYF